MSGTGDRSGWTIASKHSPGLVGTRETIRQQHERRERHEDFPPGRERTAMISNCLKTFSESRNPNANTPRDQAQ